MPVLPYYFHYKANNRHFTAAAKRSSGSFQRNSATKSLPLQRSPSTLFLLPQNSFRFLTNGFLTRKL